MIRVVVDVEPHGDKTLSRTLAEIVIANITGGGGRVSSDYAWRIRRVDRDNQEAVAHGCLVDSYNGNALDLLMEVLAEWKSGRKAPIDNHGNATVLISDHEAFWSAADPEPTKPDASDPPT